MKEVVIVSLGGSLIIPETINVKFLEEFKKIILKNAKKYKFVIVCGGGKTARNYINGLEEQRIFRKRAFQSFLGIEATRLNAKFLIYFFGMRFNKTLPKDMKDIGDYLKKNRVVICGALRYSKNQTSDSTAVKLARNFNSVFINRTSVPGLYDKNPKKYKNAKFIPQINYKDFLNIAKKNEFHPGQNFVIDQAAAKIIKRYKIKSFIVGDLKNFDNLLNGRHFVGTIIE